VLLLLPAWCIVRGCVCVSVCLLPTPGSVFQEGARKVGPNSTVAVWAASAPKPEAINETRRLSSPFNTPKTGDSFADIVRECLCIRSFVRMRSDLPFRLYVVWEITFFWTRCCYSTRYCSVSRHFSRDFTQARFGN